MLAKATGVLEGGLTIAHIDSIVSYAYSAIRMSHIRVVHCADMSVSPETLF